ncbi:HNH endonuclease [Micromonospora zamorensis]|uniref:HNH endonuclease n=1 Tax=Micromonospora zamorensis TaxID=709883 RepID=UPI0037A96F19
MILDALDDPAAVHKAAQEYRELGRAAFRERYGYGGVQRYWVSVDDQLYDAKAIAGVAYGYQHPDRGALRHDQFSGGETGANLALSRLGFAVVSSKPTTVNGERIWRQAVGQHLERAKNNNGYVTADDLRVWGAYGGGQGVWVDSERTKEIDPVGIAVGVLHTGIHYADDLNDDGILYHYPKTNRTGRRDQSEVDAMKKAAQLRVPVFVISKPTPSSRWRDVRLAWIEGWDDLAQVFSLTFHREAPARILSDDDSDGQPFVMFGNSSRRSTGSRKQRPGQRLFKFRVIQRYGSLCPLTGVTVAEMLDAAHLVPDAAGGSSDPRNGLPMNAALHRAFDAGLFAIRPDTLEVIVQPGLAAEDLGIIVATIANLPKKPHPDALTWRYEWWINQPKNAPLLGLLSPS